MRIGNSWQRAGLDSAGDRAHWSRRTASVVCLAAVALGALVTVDDSAVPAGATGPGSITEYPVPTSNGQPYGITTGPHSELWLTGTNGNKIGQSSTSLSQPSSSLPANAAIAGARVSSAGTVLYWWNYYGGKPTVSHSPGSGLYYVRFPGVPVLGQGNTANSVLAVTPDTPSEDCTAANADYLGAGATASVAVETKDCTNSFADRGFHLVVFGPPVAPPTPISPTAVAGARYNASGTLLYWWNDFGGAPTLSHSPGSGIYYVKFPGVTVLGDNAAGPVPVSVLSVTPDTPSDDCTALNADYLGAGATASVAVETKDCTNSFADRGFHLVVFGPGAGGPSFSGPTAVAGARYNASGTLLYWWNDFGGAPTLSHSSGSGLYYVRFPGVPVLGQGNTANSVLSVTPDTPSADCTVANADYLGAGATASVAVETKDCTNSFADRGFHLVVFGPRPSTTPTGTTTTTTPSSSGAWSGPVAIDAETNSLTALSCASASFCMAVDTHGDAISFDGSSWRDPKRITSIAGGFNDVSCAPSSSCVATDANAQALSFTANSWRAPVKLPTAGAFGVSLVSCRSRSFCAAAVGLELDIFDGKAWTGTATDDNHAVDEALSCASSSFCMALDEANRYWAYVGGRWSEGGDIDPAAVVTSLSCPSASFCVAVDGVGDAVMFNGGTWGKPSRVDKVAINSVSCPSAGFCAAVDSSGNALTFNGRTWTKPRSINGGEALSGVSCASATFCMAFDTNGHVLTYHGRTSD